MDSPTGSSRLEVVDAAGKRSPVSGVPPGRVRAAAWNPVNDRLAILLETQRKRSLGLRADYQEFEVWMGRLDGGQFRSTRLSSEGAELLEALVWSGDGKRLLAHSHEDGPSIRSWGPDGTTLEPVPLAGLSAVYGIGCLGTNGTILFEATATDTYETALYAFSFVDGPNLKPITEPGVHGLSTDPWCRIATYEDRNGRLVAVTESRGRFKHRTWRGRF